jgi:hypothetical protein
MRVFELYALAKKLIKENKLQEADALLEQIIFKIASFQRKGIKMVDEVDIETWRVRVWTTIEKAGLLNTK